MLFEGFKNVVRSYKVLIFFFEQDIKF